MQEYIRASASIRRESTAQERAEAFSRWKCKARTVVGRGEKSLLCDPGSELRLFTGGREKRKGEDKKRDGNKKKQHHAARASYASASDTSQIVYDMAQVRLKKGKRFELNPFRTAVSRCDQPL